MSASLIPGQVLLGRYRLMRPLNEGGMSVVWAAVHTLTGKQVALKLLKADSAQDESVKRRMLREARAACAVIHPNVLQVHDVLELEDGSPVLVMDLLAGESLRERLLRRPILSLEETAILLLPVVSGVGTAHAAGIIHRDLKPENIFLSDEAGQVRVKVLDFGIAKLVNNSSAMSTSNALTNAGTMLGTPYYMAPEQIVGEGVDHRADIWSIGIILYECLAGVRPTEAESIGKILRRVITHDIAPLSSRLPSLPRDVLALVGRMLAAEPKDRPYSLREVGEVLAPYATGVNLSSFGAPTIAPTSADTSGERSALSSEPNIRLPYESGDLDARRSSPEYAETLIAGQPAEPPPRPAKTAEPSTAGVVGTKSNPAPQSVRREPSAPRGLLIAVVAIGLAGAVGAAAYFGALKGRGRTQYVPATATAMEVGNGPCPAGMGYVPGGAFKMGSDDGKADEQPVHDVTVAAFCMDLTELLASSYLDCMQRGECKAAESTVMWQGLEAAVRERESTACTAYNAANAGLPLNCVSWETADAYCRTAGKRLPTEAEWEYAAAGGSERRAYPWGNAPPGPALLNACDRSCAAAVEKQGGTRQRPMFEEDDGYPDVAPVGKFTKGDSKFGMHDMAGNVWEWTASPYCTYPEHTCSSPYRVFRGSGWAGRYVANARASARMWSAPAHRYNDVGFRCAKDAR